MIIEWPKSEFIDTLILSYHQAKSRHGNKPGCITFNFPKSAWLEPATICMLAQEILKNPGSSPSFEGDDDALNYLSRLDFFRTIGVKRTEEFTRHPDGGRVIPLLKVSNQNEVHDAVCRICDMVSRHVPSAREFLPAMEWTVNEIIDNITIHSQTRIPGLVAAQYYPDQKRIRIGIVDAGLGIRATLAPRYKFEKDFLAIEKALERGVTRDPAIGQGNGLAGSLEIANLNKGDLTIISGQGFFRASKANLNRGKSEANLQGTLVSLSLDTAVPVDLMNTFMAESAAGWNYFDAEAQRLVEGNGIRIANEVVHTRGREPARALRNKIRCLVDSVEGDGKLKLDFSGVNSPSSSFLDELLGRLVSELTQPVFKAKVEVTGMTDQVRAFARAVVSQRLKQDASH